MAQSGTGSSSNMKFVKGALVMSVTVLILLPTFITIFIGQTEETSEVVNDLMSGYTDMTGQQPTSEEVWGLTGIYTPYGQDKDGNASNAWGRTDDGWVYGQRVTTYSPTQYNGGLNGTAESYEVYYDSEDKVYRYSKVGADLAAGISVKREVGSSQGDAYKGDILTSVSMDVSKKSNVFFTSGGKQELENGTFYYTFGGADGGAYRYCFQPLRDYLAVGTSGSATDVAHTKTSLSLIWYQYYNDSGISGQLILSGSDTGVAYLTSTEIINSYNSSNYTSKFKMAFNGIDMNVYIQLNPYAITHGYTPAQCYNAGFWSVLVTSPSTTASEGMGSLSAFDISNVFDVIVNMLTFNMSEYNISPMWQTLTTILFSMSFYIALISIAMEYRIVWVFAAIIAAIQAIKIF